MSIDEWIVLRLEVDRYADPITGTLAKGDAEERSFTGWLALTEAIEAIRTTHAETERGDDLEGNH